MLPLEQPREVLPGRGAAWNDAGDRNKAPASRARLPRAKFSGKSSRTGNILARNSKSKVLTAYSTLCRNHYPELGGLVSQLFDSRSFHELIGLHDARYSAHNSRRVRARASRAAAELASDWGNGASVYSGYGRPRRISIIESPPFKISAPGQRIVAIGDLHGDFEVTKAALRLGGVLSLDEGGDSGPHGEDLRWTGGNTIVVQLGDILDRGGDEIAILSLLRHLDTQAREVGGRVYQINGNHETINVCCEFRYVTEEGFHECELFQEYCAAEWRGDYSAAFAEWWREAQAIKRRRWHGGGWASWNPLQMRRYAMTRGQLFRTGGPLAMELSRHGVALLVNSTLFAHGGVLPRHVEYGLDRMNEEVSRWMRGATSAFGEAEPMPFIATRGFDSVVWSRLYSQELFPSPDEGFKVCRVLGAALGAVGAERLVVGHTPQIGGANSACDGRVWRIDVGMSSGMLNAPPQVLEIDGDAVRILGGESYAESPSFVG